MTTATKNLGTMLLDHMIAGHSAKEAAELAVAELDRTELERMVMPSVINQARLVHRNWVRAAERKAKADVELGVDPKETVHINLTGDGFRFAIPQLGITVLWSEATPQQLRLRAEFLRKVARGANASADYYIAVARDLEKNGLECVGDYAKPPVEEEDYDELGVEIS